jgi:hypothetical protein
MPIVHDGSIQARFELQAGSTERQFVRRDKPRPERSGPVEVLPDRPHA